MDRTTRVEEKGARFKVLTFNTFPGSPVPYLLNGTRSLYNDGDRLARMVAAIEAENCDIVCFQELNCHACRDHFKNYFAHTYTMVHSTDVSPCGTALWIGLHLLVWALLCLAVRSALLPWWTLKTHIWADVVVVLMAAALCRWLLHKTTLDVFLGEDETGLAIMYRSGQFFLGADGFSFKNFECQTGDFMNWANPRAYMQIDLRLCSMPSRSIHVFNTHMNALGSPTHRESQASELARAASKFDAAVVCGDFNDVPTSAAARVMRDSGLIDVMDNVAARDTWVARNPLSVGWMRVDDLCVDYVFRSCHFSQQSACVCIDSAPFVSDHLGVRVELSLMKD